MKEIAQYVLEAVAADGTIKLKTSPFLPDNVQYAANVVINTAKLFIFVIQTNDGYACASYDPKSGEKLYIYLNTLNNVKTHFEWMLKPSRRKNISTLGADGEIHYDFVTVKAKLPKKYQAELVEKNARSLFNNMSSRPDVDQLYGLLKRQGKGIWKVPITDYVDFTQTKVDKLKICVDGQYYEDNIDGSYIPLVPNPKAGIEKDNTVIQLYKSSLGGKQTLLDVYFNDCKKVLFVLVDNSIKYDGGKITVCTLDRLEGDTLYLNTSTQLRLTGDDSSYQFMDA